jgi:osmoprotectant transport system permease protein
VSENLRLQLARLPSLFGEHIVISAVALGLGLSISLPLALVLVRVVRLRWPVLAVAGVVQAVPSLALLALMVPLLGAFGFWPALLALVLYSVLPVLQNTVTGILEVDPAVREAAVGVGMTPLQVLLQVELPLALPVIVAGIRTATVWVVGVATLSTPVGQPSLGNYIFAGLQTRNWTAVLVGCGAAASLAVTLDLLLSGLERGIVRRSRARQWGALVGLAIAFGGGALAPRLFSGAPGAAGAYRAAEDEPGGSVEPSEPAASAPLRVGSKTFTEQYILAALLRARLEAAALPVERVDSLGSTVAFDALRNGDLDVYVDYTGTIWANYMRRPEPEAGWRVEAQTAAWLAREHGIRQLGALGFENTYALAMRRDHARELNVRSVADLAGAAPRLKLGSDYEFFHRPEWQRLRRTYGLDFAGRVSFDSTFMYDAVRQGHVDVITAFSSDGRIAAFDLAVLSDPQQAFPPYDAVLLLSPRAAGDARVVRALAPLVGRIPVDLMRLANLMVDRDEDKHTPVEAARWLWEETRKGR